jgi:predicted SAM-dependent methyltransferase
VIKKLHIGCGMNAPSDFDNFDVSPTLRFERIPIFGAWYTKNSTRFPRNVRYGNIAYGLNGVDDYYDACYCSHVLEHLSKDEFDIAIENVQKYLKPGGVFRLIMPDLHKYVTTYLNNYNRDYEYSSTEFINQTLLGTQEFRKRNLLSIIKNGLSNSRHIWLWDDITTMEALKQAGFDGITKRSFNVSSTDYFSNIEKESSFNNAFCIECIKR